VLNYIKKKKIKIGILGGSFDPAHIGHLKISKIAKKKFNLDYILWIITKKNPFKKKSINSINKRLLFSKNFTKKIKYIKVEFLEKNAKSNKTINLIKFIKKINPSLKVYFIIGADNLINFHKWTKWKEIIKLSKILVFDRNGYKSKALKSKTFKYMDKNYHKFIKFKKINVSSSQIRKICYSKNIV